MKRIMTTVAAAATALLIGSTPVFADGGHHHDGGISTGAAVALGLGAFALGGALTYPAWGSYYYHRPLYYAPPYYAPAQRQCWNGYVYYPC